MFHRSPRESREGNNPMKLQIDGFGPPVRVPLRKSYMQTYDVSIKVLLPPNQKQTASSINTRSALPGNKIRQTTSA